MVSAYPQQCRLDAMGKGDNGRIIYTFVIEAKAGKKAATVLINNGIHPGEPDGVDASLEFAQKVLKGELKYPNTRLVIIPIYNVDGNALQSCCTRANQNGPINQGFRGNARNLDLNRDFIKADAENTKAFYKIFHTYKPHVFIDNHVSNGADYQYTMTLISSQADKLGPVLGPFLRNEFEPYLFEQMSAKGLPMAPYVNTVSAIPDSGIVGFLETPRFATGYAALFNCIGFVPETHMLKPFPSRVIATRKLMETMCDYVNENSVRFLSLKARAEAADQKRQSFALNWKLQKERKENFIFKGYEAGYKPSEISGLPRLYYDRTKPFTKKIPFYNHFVGQDSVSKPRYFIIPQAWHQVINRLKMNGIVMKEFKKDTMINVLASYIQTYRSREQPYEGHYLHSDTKIEQERMDIQFFAGDQLISTEQVGIRFLMETLSPAGADSYFNWNFFDSVLQQKEYFSDYVFEDTGAEILKNSPQLQKKLADKKAMDPAFAKNRDAQLNFIYENSEYHEKTYKLYPVFLLP